MLSEEQISMLSTRVSVLQSELEEKIGQFGINQDAIEQELAESMDSLKDDQDNNDLIELVWGLKDALKWKKIITLMREWIQNRQVDLQLDKNHPELTAIGIEFTPKQPAQKSPKQPNPRFLYQKKILIEADQNLQDAMLFLFEMGFSDFDINHSALKLAQEQGVSTDELVDQAIENIQNPQEQIQTAKDEESQEISKVLVIKNAPDENAIEQRQPQQSPRQNCMDDEPAIPSIQRLEELKNKILQSQQQFFQPQDQQRALIQQQYSDQLQYLQIKKAILQEELKYSIEPTETKIDETITFLQNQDENVFEKKIKDLQQYKELITLLPQYEAFLIKRPQDHELQTVDQVMIALNIVPQIEEKLKFLDYLLDEGKIILYQKVLQQFDELTSTDEYKQIKTHLDNLAQDQDWNSMNIKLIQTFQSKDSTEIILKHSSIKYFINLEEDKENEVMNPIIIELIIHNIESIALIESDFQSKFQLQQLCRILKDGNINQAIKECDSMTQKQKIHQIFKDHNLKQYQNHLQLKQSVLSQLLSLNIESEFKQSYYFKTLTHNILQISFDKSRIINCFMQLHQRNEPQFKQENLLSLIAIYKILNEQFNIGLRPFDFFVQVIDNSSNSELIKEILYNLIQDQNQKEEFKNQINQEEK